ncbi:MAG: thiamine-phosphate kinase [Rhodospirillales bacterium]|nr:thiamine-phosphate kinase [Rhodospirillales bacterium]
MNPANRPGEFETIRRFFAPLAKDVPGAMNLTDDAALLNMEEGKQLVVTSDALVAGVHFLPDDPPADIAVKALRVNLSDLASMGALPLAYTLAAAYDPTVDDKWLAAFSSALSEDQRQFGISLIGGDTVATPGPLTLSICAFGTVDQGTALTRSGAQTGDALFLSGTIGDAALGLDVLKRKITGVSEADGGYLIDRYRRPKPRCRLGPRLSGLANAAIDVSDGLVADLRHVCEASGVSAVVDLSCLPLSDEARRVAKQIEDGYSRILTGGDDYEILFTAPVDRKDAVIELSSEIALPLTEIGRIVETVDNRARAEVEIVDDSGRRLSFSGGGFRHF